MHSYLRRFLPLAIGLIGTLLLAPLATSQPQDIGERDELRSFLEQTINTADSFEDRYDAEVWLIECRRASSDLSKIRRRA